MNDELYHLFLADYKKHTSLISDHLLEIEKGGDIKKSYAEIIRATHSIKGASRLVQCEYLEQFYHQLEGLIKQAEERALILDSATTTQILNALDASRQLLDKPSPAKAEKIKALLNTIDIEKTANDSSDIIKISIDHADELFQLFFEDFNQHKEALTNGLLILEQTPKDRATLKSVMRSAHTIKGASLAITANTDIDLNLINHLSHRLEDIFVAAQNSLILSTEDTSSLLKIIDIMADLLAGKEIPQTLINERYQQLDQILKYNNTQQKNPSENKTPSAENKTPPSESFKMASNVMNQLIGLTSQSLVESKWLLPSLKSLKTLRHLNTEIMSDLNSLLNQITNNQHKNELSKIIVRTQAYKKILGEHINDLDLYSRQNERLQKHIYHTALSSRMRPFSEGIQGLQRMARDLGQKLNKKVQMKITGLATTVDRDILTKLQAPLTHLIRNAVDHGIEPPAERIKKQKKATGTLTLEAQHIAGMLVIRLSDDGCGIDLELLKQKIISKKLASQSMLSQFNQSELLDFLFLPNFSTRKQVSEISGRGVGLDIVKDFCKVVRGSVVATTKKDNGLYIELKLPLTLSVMRTMIAEISNETYAFPLARIKHIYKVSKEDIQRVDNRQYFNINNESIGLIHAAEVLELAQSKEQEKTLFNIINIGDHTQSYGLIVDKILGEKEIVVQPLDKRLGKVRDVFAAALLEDGLPTIIIDIDDLLISIEALTRQQQIKRLQASAKISKKTILVVDDSITVREVEKKMLENQGYTVDVAVDGMDAWNRLRDHHYDLIITDVDMPRMDGIELVHRIKKEAKLKPIPIMIISYKDRQQDKKRGLDAGADYYLAKRSFHDETLIDAVFDLIGKA